MSKTQLRKELMLLSKEQLIDLTLDAYSARREVKEYFDFFLNPDAKKLQEKYLDLAFKEISRNKHRRMKCRVSVLTKAMKDFASFDPGIEWIIGTRISVFLQLIKACGEFYYTETIARYAVKFLTDIIIQTDRAAILDRYMPMLIKNVDSLRGADYLKKQLQEVLENASSLTNPLNQ